MTRVHIQQMISICLKVAGKLSVCVCCVPNDHCCGACFYVAFQKSEIALVYLCDDGCGHVGASWQDPHDPWICLE